MPRKRFGELNPEEVLMVGIDVEETNGTRLRAFADMFTGYAPEVAELFTEMAAEEDEHRSQLEKLYARRHGTLRRTITHEDVLEVIEATDLDDAEHLVFGSLTLRRALEVVLAAELQAQAFYGQALENTDEPELQALFRELSEFEADHVQGIEARIKALGDSA